MNLSSDILRQHNLLYDVQCKVCQILHDDCPELSSVPIYPENKKDIDFEILKALKQLGIVGMVLTPTANFQGYDSGKSTVWTLPDLTIEIAENPKLNRTNLSSITGLDAAMYVAETLGGRDVDQFGTSRAFNLKSIEQGEDGGLIVNKVTLQCMVQSDDENM